MGFGIRNVYNIKIMHLSVTLTYYWYSSLVTLRHGLFLSSFLCEIKYEKPRWEGLAHFPFNYKIFR